MNKGFPNKARTRNCWLKTEPTVACMKPNFWESISSDTAPSIRELNLCPEITRQNHFDGENHFKSQSEKPPKQPWRGKTSLDITRFPAKPIFAGNSTINSNLGTSNQATKQQTRTATQRLGCRSCLLSVIHLFLRLDVAS